MRPRTARGWRAGGSRAQPAKGRRAGGSRGQPTEGMGGRWVLPRSSLAAAAATVGDGFCSAVEVPGVPSVWTCAQVPRAGEVGRRQQVSACGRREASAERMSLTAAVVSSRRGGAKSQQRARWDVAAAAPRSALAKRREAVAGLTSVCGAGQACRCAGAVASRGSQLVAWAKGSAAGAWLRRDHIPNLAKISNDHC